METVELEIGYEVLFIEENASGGVSVLLSQELIGMMSPAHQEEVIKGLITLGKDQLITDMQKSPKNAPFPISPALKNPKTVLNLRFIVEDNGDFTLLTYFGQAMPKNFNLQDALNRALFIIDSFEKELNK